MRVAVARMLLRLGISPNAVTILGTVGVVVGALTFAATGWMLVATAIVAASTAGDLLDGTMARLSRRTTTFGAFLDSVLDRVADGAVCTALIYWYIANSQLRPAIAALLVLVTGYLVPYTRARAEAVGLSGEAGIAPRFVRLRVLGVGGLLGGIGVPHAMEVALWCVVALAAATVLQRVHHVHRQLYPQDASQ
jgi:CDP-diacylglycerol--glycerol-3-phosphate 3-phosphatidyltransferase